MRNKPLEFVGVDGEYLQDHGYCLLQASTGARLERDRPLLTEEVFAWLFSLHAKGRILCAYGLGYDVQWWLTDLPQRDLSRLVAEGNVTWFGGKGTYTLHYVPNRFLEVRKGHQAFAKIWDLQPWFGCSFVKALERWGYPMDGSTGTALRWGKEHRGTFTVHQLTAIRAYNQWECMALSWLGERLCERLDTIGLRPNQWYGPGAVAAKLLLRHKVAEANVPPGNNVEGWENLFRRAYYGGRIQALQIGRCGPSLRYDLRSAYASALVGLPSLRGEWQPTKEVHPWGLYQVRWSTPKGHDLTPFPWRDEEGHIHYPPSGRGWQWGSLVAAAQRGPWKVTVEEGWRLQPEKPEERPFAFLRDVHAQRIALGADPLGDVLKAAMVATYGKTAQQTGTYASRYRSLAWAGMVTAGVQARLLAAALLAPDRVVSFLTDCLMVRGQEPLELSLGEGLGQWSEQPIRGLWVFQPACYVTQEAHRDRPGGVDFRLHAAAIPQPDGQMLARRMVGQWLTERCYGKVSYADRIFCGMAMAQQRGWEYWRRWLDVERDLTLRPSMGFPQEAEGGDDRMTWATWSPGEDYLVASRPYVPKGGLVDDRWAGLEAIRAAEECSR